MTTHATVREAWEADADRIRWIVRFVDAADEYAGGVVLSIVNEALVDLLQGRWLRTPGPVGPSDEEFSTAYRSVNEALGRFGRRFRSAAIRAEVDALARDGRAVLARCAEIIRFLERSPETFDVVLVIREQP